MVADDSVSSRTLIVTQAWKPGVSREAGPYRFRMWASRDACGLIIFVVGNGWLSAFPHAQHRFSKSIIFGQGSALALPGFMIVAPWRCVRRHRKANEARAANARCTYTLPWPRHLRDATCCTTVEQRLSRMPQCHAAWLQNDHDCMNVMASICRNFQ